MKPQKLPANKILQVKTENCFKENSHDYVDFVFWRLWATVIPEKTTRNRFAGTKGIGGDWIFERAPPADKTLKG